MVLSIFGTHRVVSSQVIRSKMSEDCPCVGESPSSKSCSCHMQSPMKWIQQPYQQFPNPSTDFFFGANPQIYRRSIPLFYNGLFMQGGFLQRRSRSPLYLL